MVPYAVLTAADRQNEAFVGDPAEAFDDNLIQAVFFQGGAVLPDILAYISTVLENWAPTAGLSLLEHTIADGFTLPALRGDGSCTSFVDSLALVEKQKIAGVQDRRLTVAERLDASLQVCETPRILTLDPRISFTYASAMRQAMQFVHEVDPTTVRPDFQHQLKAMTRFSEMFHLRKTTEECISRITSTKQEGELLRSDFLTTLLLALNGVRSYGRTTIVDSKTDLINHPACSHPLLASAIQGYVMLANGAYHVNLSNNLLDQSQTFDAGAYFESRVYTETALAGLSLAICPSATLSSRLGDAPVVADTIPFSEEVRLPSVQQIREIPWPELKAVRRDLGAGYFAALKSWQERPHCHEADLRIALRQYSAALSSRVKDTVPMARVWARKYSQSDQSFMGSALTKALEILGTQTKARTIFGMIGTLCDIVYSWKTERSVTVRHTAVKQPPKSIVVRKENKNDNLPV